MVGGGGGGGGGGGCVLEFITECFTVFQCFFCTAVYTKMHENYDSLGKVDGLVSYDEIKRALGGTPEEEWNKEIEPHDVDGDKLLTPAGFGNI